MQYVRSFGGSVSKTWNSINPANLSGAIDVVVVEQEDGTLACSPFHVRFGKITVMRPSDKKVEFRVNGVKQEHSLKLGDGGEAFFIFETSADIPDDLQTSPLLSAASSPESLSVQNAPGDGNVLQEPEYLDLNSGGGVGSGSVKRRSTNLSGAGINPLMHPARATSDLGTMTPLSGGSPPPPDASLSDEWNLPRKHTLERSASEEFLPAAAREQLDQLETATRAPTVLPTTLQQPDGSMRSSRPVGHRRSISPPAVSTTEAVNRAIALSKKLSGSNIPTHVTESGDLMLDMTGYKASEEDALRAELIARRVLADELKGNYDIGALIGSDENGNLWIYSSEEAKEAAASRCKAAPFSSRPSSSRGGGMELGDATSDPGYASDEGAASADEAATTAAWRRQASSAAATAPHIGLATPPKTPPDKDDAGAGAAAVAASDSVRNYAKTLRLTSNQLKAMNLKHGANTMTFSVNNAKYQANMYYWMHDVPVVISDIDGTITKSDAWGHILTMIGRDWTQPGVAKLFTDIVANGYNIMYLTSRSIGQADTTRAYLDGVVQDGIRLPKGPVILSPDRTIAALRREVYLRKPEIFKMACLRDILSLYQGSGGGGAPASSSSDPLNHQHQQQYRKKNVFYAGFGNRLTDALSYRSVNIPSNRIFTINSDAEVSLDILSMSKYRSSYVSMREVVDHFFPPVGLLLKEGGEAFTDFMYWRDQPLPTADFSDSESEDDEGGGGDGAGVESSGSRGRQVAIRGRQAQAQQQQERKIFSEDEYDDEDDDEEDEEYEDDEEDDDEDEEEYEEDEEDEEEGGDEYDGSTDAMTESFLSGRSFEDGALTTGSLLGSIVSGDSPVVPRPPRERQRSLDDSHMSDRRRDDTGDAIGDDAGLEDGDTTRTLTTTTTTATQQTQTQTRGRRPRRHSDT